MSANQRFWFFSRTRALMRQIDEYLDAVSEGAIVFEQGMRKYLEGDDEGFQIKHRQLSDLEHLGDSLKRRIQTEIYSEMLIPESRGDVLHLIWHLDELLDNLKRQLQLIDIVRPAIPPDIHPLIRELIAAVHQSIDATVLGARAYFRDVRAVRDHVQKAIFFESESDQAEQRLLRWVFSSQLDEVHKHVLRETIEAISLIANIAEDGADHLLIYAIKRLV